MTILQIGAIILANPSIAKVIEHHLYWILEIIVNIIVIPVAIVNGTGAYACVCVVFVVFVVVSSVVLVVFVVLVVVVLSGITQEYDVEDGTYPVGHTSKQNWLYE